MQSTTKLKSRGFTITEVMIVLAVAALIMAIIFTAVPQLERTQRDTTRRNLAGRLLSSIETYASNNQGEYPFTGITGQQSTPPATWDATADCSQPPAVVPQTCYDWYHNYVDGKINITDPSSNASIVIYYSNSTTIPSGSVVAPGNVFIGVGDSCSGASLKAGSDGDSSFDTKQFAVLTALEGSGGWTCLDNG
jgi:prepilin-type N-terminal cleavage/methylation domain-containing protein